MNHLMCVHGDKPVNRATFDVCLFMSVCVFRPPSSYSVVSILQVYVSSGGIIKSASSLSVPPIDPSGTGAQNWWAATHAQLGSLADGTQDPSSHNPSGHTHSRHGPTPSSDVDFREYSAKHELSPSANNAWELHTMRWEPSRRGQRGNSRRGTRLSQRGVNSRRGPLTPRTSPNKSSHAKQASPHPVLTATSAAAPQPGGLPEYPNDASRAEQAKALGASTKRASQWSARKLVQSPEPPRAASHKPIGGAATKNADAAAGSPEATQSSRQHSTTSNNNPNHNHNPNNNPNGTAPLLESGNSVLPVIRHAPPDDKANVAKAFDILLGVGAEAGGNYNHQSSRPPAQQSAPKPHRVSSAAARPATYTPGAMRNNKLDTTREAAKARAATVSTCTHSSPHHSGAGSKRGASASHPLVGDGKTSREISSSYRAAIADLDGIVDGIVKRSDPHGIDSSESGGDVLPLMPADHAYVARMRDARGGGVNQKRYVSG